MNCTIDLVILKILNEWNTVTRRYQELFHCLLPHEQLYLWTVISCRNFVRPSVRPSHACFVTKSNKAVCIADILIPHEKALTLVFWYQQWLAGDAPFRLKFAFKVIHPSHKRRLRQITAYNVSTIRDREKKSILTNIESRPRAFPRVIDGVRRLPLSHPRGGSKKIFLFFK